MPRKYTPAEAEAAFWSRVDKSGGPDACWPWTGGTNKGGYGTVGWEGKIWIAHRVAWVLTNGPIPRGDGYHGTCACHRCDNRRCCNPAHIWLGTNADNAADRSRKGRSARLCGDANPARLRPDRLARGDASGSRLHPERRPRGLASGMYTHPEKRSIGEHNGRAMLTEDDVRAIRAQHASGEGTSAIARRFGVVPSTINHITAGRTWRHVK